MIRIYVMIAALLAPAQALAAPDPLMLDTATDMVLGGICSTERCRDEERHHVRSAASRILEACEAPVNGCPFRRDCKEMKLPGHACFALVMTGVESGYHDHPTCGAGAKCIEKCAALMMNHRTGKQSHRCLLGCIKASGRTPTYHQRRCNDFGLSAGPFQLRKKNIAACSKDEGRPLDPHNLEEAARCYMSRVAATARANSCRASDPWPSAFARIAAWNGGRCGANAYAYRALKWWEIYERRLADSQRRASAGEAP